SQGRTRLFIQCIDFLAVRRRPAPEKYFLKFLAVDRALRQRLAAAAGEPAWLAAPGPAIRAHLLAASAHDRALVDAVLDARQPAAPARPASTASSSTTPTPTRWPRSSRG